MIRYRSRDFNCPLELAFDVLGGRWKPRILWFLGDNTLRSGELEKMMPDTTRKVLIEQLRELEQDGLVNRTVYAQVPPKVEYSLTERAIKLRPILSELRQWGIEHTDYMKNREILLSDEPIEK